MDQVFCWALGMHTFNPCNLEGATTLFLTLPTREQDREAKIPALSSTVSEGPSPLAGPPHPAKAKAEAGAHLCGQARWGVWGKAGALAADVLQAEAEALEEAAG